LGISINNQKDGQCNPSELKETIHFTNFFLSIFLINRIFVNSVNSNEFGYTTYLPEKDILSEAFRGYSQSEKLFKERHKNLDLEDFKRNRKIIPLKTLDSIIKLAKGLCNNEMFIKLLSLLLDSHTNLKNREFNQSLILSWTIIEQYINHIWNILLESQLISNDEKGKLKSAGYAAEKKINTLARYKFLDDYKNLHKIRDKRNKLLHEIFLIRNDTAVIAFNFAFKYVNILISKYLSNPLETRK